MQALFDAHVEQKLREFRAIHRTVCTQTKGTSATQFAVTQPSEAAEAAVEEETSGSETEQAKKTRRPLRQPCRVPLESLQASKDRVLDRKKDLLSVV